MVMKKINTSTKIIIHLGSWLLLLFSYYIFTRNFNLTFDIYYHISDILLYAFVFYVNYYLLMPFLFKKKVVLFVVLSLTLFTGAIFLEDILNKRHFIEVFMNRPEGMMPPMPEGMMPPMPEGMTPPMPGYAPDHFPKAPPDFAKMGPMKTQFIIINAFGIFIFYTLSFAIRFIQKWKDDEKNQAELEKEKIQTELFFLKQQINPHFLFNSLNSIYSLAISKSEATTTAILKLSSILRYVLYEPATSVSSLQDEIKVIRDYIDLQKLRLIDKVQVDFQLYGELDHYKIEPFILIPIIENAFKYGVDNVNPSLIQILIWVVNNNLWVEISNKIIMRPADDITDSGIGLTNIKRRLELLYPGLHTFSIQNKNDNFLVSLELKLKQ